MQVFELAYRWHIFVFFFFRVRNQAYTELCKSRAGNDRYAERSMQTFNEAPKGKEVQCESVIHQDASKGQTL